MADRRLRTPWWLSGTIALAIAVIGVVSVSMSWHEPHQADQDCVVCQLRHQTTASLTAAPETGPASTFAPLAERPVPVWTGSDHRSKLPARAPPA